jgi:hypothetical protein
MHTVSCASVREALELYKVRIRLKLNKLFAFYLLLNFWEVKDIFFKPMLKRKFVGIYLVIQSSSKTLECVQTHLAE